MPYWVYGRDSETGEPTEPFYSEADRKEAAQIEAESQGIIVESVEHEEKVTTEESVSILDPQPESKQSRKPSHEFSEDQVQVIKSLAGYMRVFGGALIVGGAVAIISSFMSKYHESLKGLIGLTLGGLTFFAANSFMKIVKTHNNDVDHLIDALSTLKLVYAIQVWCLVTVFIVAAITILLAVSG